MKSSDARKNEEPPHEELVRHLVRCMEKEGLVIESANLPGHKRPDQVKRGFTRSRLRPDAVGRDGRRTIFGVAASGQQISASHLPGQLETLAARCRLLVVCLPAEGANEVVETVLRKGRVPNWRKVRLLRHPLTKWGEVPKAAAPVGPPGVKPDVRVRIDGEL